MGKWDFVKELAGKLGVSNTEAVKVYDHFVGIIQTHLEQGEDVDLYPIGNFIIREVKPHKYHNPQSEKGSKLQQSKGRKKVVFKSGYFYRFFKYGKKEEKKVVEKQEAEQPAQ